MPRSASRISNTDTPVDKKKYDENFERIFGTERKRSIPFDPEHDFIEGSANDKFKAGYDETFGAK